MFLFSRSFRFSGVDVSVVLRNVNISRDFNFCGREGKRVMKGGRREKRKENKREREREREMNG